MSKDIEKKTHASGDGDRLEVKAIRESAEFQNGGVVRLGNGKIVSGHSHTGKGSKITSGTSFDVIAAAVSRSGLLAMDVLNRRANQQPEEAEWVMVTSSGAKVSGASAVSVRIDEYASEMLKDPQKVRAFFKRINGEAAAG